MHSPRYNPLRRGSVLPLGVEAHLKIKVTPDLYTSPLPSYPRLVHTEPRHRSDHSEQASDVCCAFPRRSSRLGKRRCRLGSRRASTAPTLCTLAPQAVKTPATQKYSTPPYLYEQGAESPAKKLEATLREQQDYRLFAAHSSLGWSAGERGRFEIKTPFLERENAAPTTAEPQALKGAQAAEKCAAVSPRKAPSVIKTNPPRTQKPVANAKAPAPPKAQAQSWRGPVSVCWMAAFLVALVAMTCAAFGSEDATSFASAGGAQPALHTNTTGDPTWLPATLASTSILSVSWLTIRARRSSPRATTCCTVSPSAANSACVAMLVVRRRRRCTQTCCDRLRRAWVDFGFRIGTRTRQRAYRVLCRQALLDGTSESLPWMHYLKLAVRPSATMTAA